MPDLPSSTALDATLSSTPIKSDNPIFSYEAFASSPPSSPPDFPWEKSSNTKYSTASKPSQSIANAFSVLGKRKALVPITENVRPAKKPTPAVAKKDGKPFTQMQISLGQEVQKKCKSCGMEYIASSDEDRKLHDKYHKQNVEGYDVGKDFLSKGREGSVLNTSKGDHIAALDGHDNVWRKKRARAALDVVQRELGAVDIPDKQLWDTTMKHSIRVDACMSRHTMYMYVRQNKCVGLLLVEKIKEGKKVVEPAKPASTLDTPANAKMSALERLRAKRASNDDDESTTQPIQLSTRSTPSGLGVSRIWTSPSHRGQGIAKCLLDRALQHQNEHLANDDELAPVKDLQKPNEKSRTITKDQVAFSQPTDAGAKLARRWFGRKYGWLVYID